VPSRSRAHDDTPKMVFDDETSCSSEFRLRIAHALEARRFEVEHFSHVRAFDEQPALLQYTLEHVDPRLDTWIELGVAKGRSTRAIMRTAARQGRRPQLHAFDSFQGLPEDFIAGVGKGAFATSPPSFRDANITLHIGWFRDSLPAFAASLREQIGFIHFDADLYSSTMTAFEALSSHIGPGTVLLFDEYWNFDGCYEHEFHAFQDFLAYSRLGFRYLGYNKNYTQAAVRLLPESP
jgi:Methyltransferase domain